MAAEILVVPNEIEGQAEVDASPEGERFAALIEAINAAVPAETVAELESRDDPNKGGGFSDVGNHHI